MITVSIYVDEDGKYRAFQFAGHAGAAPYGSDIVCSAVSVLSQTAIISLKEFLPNKPRVKVREGFLSCILPGQMSRDEEEKAQVVIRTMELGIEALLPKYGQYLEIHKRRWTGCL
ncbi:MAG: ribosomal-processing cysteine protease Prp [Bacillota bacterium]|jgi:uncharacterized protein YsxB (DUF464 family)